MIMSYFIGNAVRETEKQQPLQNFVKDSLREDETMASSIISSFIFFLIAFGICCVGVLVFGWILIEIMKNL